MRYTVEFDSSFEFWAGARHKVECVRDRFGLDGVNELCDFVESCLDDCDEPPTATEINDFVWFELFCFETCHGAPQCGCELVFTIDPDETADELAEDIEIGYARQLF